MAGVMLDVANVVEVQLQAREIKPREATWPGQIRFGLQWYRDLRLGATGLGIGRKCVFVVRPIGYKLLVRRPGLRAKEIVIGQVKRLRAVRLLVRRQIKIGVVQRVVRDVPKWKLGYGTEPRFRSARSIEPASMLSAAPYWPMTAD